MKKIQHPNIGQIAWSLVPTLILSMLFILTDSLHWWMLTMAFIFLGIYFLLTNYFCIRQKCYQQLAFAYVTTALFAAYILLIIYINK